MASKTILQQLNFAVAGKMAYWGSQSNRCGGKIKHVHRNGTVTIDKNGMHELYPDLFEPYSQKDRYVRVSLSVVSLGIYEPITLNTAQL